MVRKPSEEWSEIPALTFPPAPAPPAPAPAQHPQPQPRLHPSGNSSEGGGRLQFKILRYLFFGVAVAHFDHKIFKFFRGGSGFMDARYEEVDKNASQNSCKSYSSSFKRTVMV